MALLHVCLVGRREQPSLLVVATSEEQLAEKLDKELPHVLYEEDFRSLIEDKYLLYTPHSYWSILEPYQFVLDTVEL